MPFILKLLIVNIVIIAASELGRRVPSLSGLIATMPLTSIIVMLWIYDDAAGNPGVMVDYARGAVWGILPSILFFVAAYACLSRGLHLWPSMAAGFGVWFLGALVHQAILR